MKISVSYWNHTASSLQSTGSCQWGNKNQLKNLKTPSQRPQKKLVTIARLAEGLGFIENELQIPHDIDSNDKRVTATRQGIQRLVAYYEEILHQKKKSSSHQMTLLDFMKLSN